MERLRKGLISCEAGTLHIVVDIQLYIVVTTMNCEATGIPCALVVTNAILLLCAKVMSSGKVHLPRVNQEAQGGPTLPTPRRLLHHPSNRKP